MGARLGLYDIQLYILHSKYNHENDLFDSGDVTQASRNKKKSEYSQQKSNLCPFNYH